MSSKESETAVDWAAFDEHMGLSEQRSNPVKYRVTLKTVCTMIVEVEAGSSGEAKDKARQGDYEPWTQWEPVSYSDFKAVQARPHP